MFKKTRLNLLFVYLGIFAFILGAFAIAVRIVFTLIMFNQIVDNLRTLGQTIAASSGFKNGQIQVKSESPSRNLNVLVQSQQWTDANGKVIAIDSNHNLSMEKESVQIQGGKPYVVTVNTPVFAGTDRHPVGYVRVSQSLEELADISRKLDFGLTGGAIVALVLAGFGGIIMTRQAMAPIESSFERLQQFTADASHELRSPLMAIKASSQVALRHADGMRPSDAEEFEAIALSVERMTRLTDDLLMLARMDKKLKTRWETLNLTELLESLYQQLQLQAGAKNIDLWLNPMPLFKIEGNAEQIRRLFTNLIENAIHYTPMGGKVVIYADQVGKWLEIRIEDTGIGIAPDQIPHIFARFWRADTSRSQWTGGSGLGLAIAQSIAESHGGKITVTSELGSGSCFTVSMPM